MGITRRCDYACRIIRAAYKSGNSFVSIADVAEEEDIPYSFARSIQHDLVKAGLLQTNRGVHGGLTLACDPSVTTVYDVLKCLDDSLSVAKCTCDDYPCVNKGNCTYNSVWRAANALVENLYSSITLTDLFELGDDHPAIQAALAVGAK